MALTTTLYATASAMWQNDSPDYKNTTTSKIGVGEEAGTGTDYRAAVKFDLSSLDSSTVITAAELDLYVYDDWADYTPTLRAYRITTNWSNDNVSWNTAPSISQLCGEKQLTSSYRGDTNMTLSASYVQNWITGAWTNYGLFLRMANEAKDHIVFRPKNYGTTSQRPRLQLTYYYKPSVSTSAASGIGTARATLNGNITSINGANCTVRGFQYGLSQTPTWTVNQSGSYGTGAYSLNVTGLYSGRTYYFRAYATNPAGTSYGSWQSFQVPILSSSVI